MVGVGDTDYVARAKEGEVAIVGERTKEQHD
jgi:hypothetical protein